MSWFHYALLALACAALLASWNLPRCRMWIFALAASFVVSVLYYRIMPNPHGFLPHGAFVAFACDCVLFILIRETHREAWEIRGLGTVMIASASLNALQMVGLVSGWPPMLSQGLYSSILELANAAYLLIIGGVGILERIADAETGGYHMRNHSRTGLAQAVNYANKEARKKTTTTQPLRHW